MRTHTTLIIGCGNLLRGDDALGPRLVRRLWDLGLGERVRLSDGGTAGMNVAFDMRGMKEVTLVDACRTGAEPGTIFELPGEEIDTPPLEVVNLHNFRWDHALSFAKWLLKDEYPAVVRVILVEAGQFEPGSELSPPVAIAMESVASLLRERYAPEIDDPDASRVELTPSGYLILPAAVTEAMRETSNVLAGIRGGALIITALATGAVGGLILKRRNAQGETAVLVKEWLPTGIPAGRYGTRWDAERRELIVDLARGPVSQRRVAIDELPIEPAAFRLVGASASREDVDSVPAFRGGP